MRAETAALLARSRQDLVVARHLLASDMIPHAISDAYYAMLHAAKALLVEKGVAASSHGGVLSAIGQTYVRMGHLDKTQSRHLREAFDYRQRADYEVTDQLSAEMARETIAWADAFIAAAEELLSRGEGPD
jgi:uncharacterized protein